MTAIKSLTDFRLLGHSGLRISPLCLGTMTFGTEWGWGADKLESRRILERYIEAGGNFIDTANYYTNSTSETMLGDFLKDYRNEVVIGTKYSLNMRKGDPNAGGNQRKNLRQSVEDSLRRLHTDHIDLYWMHIWDRLTPIDEVMRALDDLVRAGKILYLGISDTPAWKIAQANILSECRGWSRFVGLQCEYSLIERTAERDLIPMAEELGIGIMPWAPLGAALLTGKYTRRDLKKAQSDPEGFSAEPGSRPIVKRLTERNIAIAETVIAIAKEGGYKPAQVALRWLVDKPEINSVIIGARKLSQLQENLDCLKIELSADQRQKLDQVSEIQLGFPHDFINRPTIVELVTGGTTIIS